MKVAGLALALAASASAQSLQEALASQPGLSGLAGLLNSSLVQLPQNLNNVTLLAPSNAAIQAVPNATLGQLTSNSALLNAVLTYHILQGNYSSIANQSFIPTYLMQNVTGGQRVEAVPGTNKTTFYSGLLTNSSTVNSTLQFSGGSIHIIDRFLTPPVNVSSTAIALNQTSAVGAIIKANLTSAVDTTPDLTIFVPNNAAFRRVASAVENASTAVLASVLQYHVHKGVVYSTGIMNGSSISTLNGGNLTARVDNGTVYINNARVVLANILTSNGVIHVIDSVLNPNNTAANATGTSISDAFAGATSGSADAFTSGVPMPTSAINTAGASGTARSSSSNAAVAAKALETGAMAVAALFGAALNL